MTKPLWVTRKCFPALDNCWKYLWLANLVLCTPGSQFSRRIRLGFFKRWTNCNPWRKLKRVYVSREWRMTTTTPSSVQANSEKNKTNFLCYLIFLPVAGLNYAFYCFLSFSGCQENGPDEEWNCRWRTSQVWKKGCLGHEMGRCKFMWKFTKGGHVGDLKLKWLPTNSWFSLTW